MHPHLVILAGGVSSRMKRHAAIDGTDETLLREAQQKAKSMIGLGPGGRPLMDYIIFNAREAGYRDIVIVIGEGDESVRAHYGGKDRGNEFHGVTIAYAVQRIPAGRTKPLGTADALLCALQERPEWTGTQLTVCNSDNLYSQHAFRLLLDSAQPSALIDYDRHALQFDQERIAQFAVLQKDSEGYLLRIIEKPSAEQVAMVRDPSGRVGVSMNIFRFSYDLIMPPLREVPVNPARQEKELPSAVELMIARHPRSMITIPLAEYVPDMTSKNDIAGVQRYLRDHYPDFSF